MKRVKRAKRTLCVLTSVMLLLLNACGMTRRNPGSGQDADNDMEKPQTVDLSDGWTVDDNKNPDIENIAIGNHGSDESRSDSVYPSVEEKPDEAEGQKILRFVDVFGQEYETVINPAVPGHDYDNDRFIRDNSFVAYDDEYYTSRVGIDVSKHQGRINWSRVKEQGIEFAFIRIGYRGYGEAGNINLDQRFYENIEGAQAAGIDTGVYFFSQAINEEEALEEAAFVIDSLKGYELQLPVVYDPESILDDVARTDDVSGEQFTKNTRAFCDRIGESGYDPMIYSNMLWEAFELDLSRLTDIPIWYADYEELPQTPYHYVFWQYSNEGKVDGIDGLTDMDIQIMKK